MSTLSRWLSLSYVFALRFRGKLDTKSSDRSKDDGPYIYLNDVSDKLTAAGAKGTFFFNGFVVLPVLTDFN